MDSNDAGAHGPLSLDLIALSSLTPPSPVLGPTPLGTAFSWSEIHIELDFSVDDIGNPTSPSSAFGASELGLGILPSRCSVNSVGTVSTFGIFGSGRTPSPSTSQDFEEQRYSPLLESETMFNSSHTTATATLADSQTSGATVATDALDQLPENDNSHVRDKKGLLPDCLSDAPNYHVPHLATLINSVAEPSMSPAPDSHLILSPFLEQSRPRASSSTVSTIDDGPVDALIRHIAFEAALARLEYNPVAKRSSMVSKSIPKSLTWLSDATVEILIDQEGFRAVLACFKYSGYLSAGSQANKHAYETVQFRPTNRQVFDFHYAPLEGLPALRRISANGDESRDYISRQASLGLKANGVYFVRGTEALSFPVPRVEGEREPDASKLQWRFEYLVDDKKAEGLGKKSIDGEKTLTPLSFSCSPLLLHPLQGKKVRLMQVFKKTVITKISAEKMEPPGLPLKDDRVFLPLKTVGAHLSPTPPGAAWNAHKRTVTHFVPLLDHGPPPIGSMPPQAVTPTRRRRASSAGERNLPGANTLSSYVRLASCGKSPLLCQNIIPRSRLAAMLDAEVKRDPFQSPVMVPPIQTDAPTFHPLSPCPRHHQAVAR